MSSSGRYFEKKTRAMTKERRTKWEPLQFDVIVSFWRHRKTCGLRTVRAPSAFLQARCWVFLRFVGSNIAAVCKKRIHVAWAGKRLPAPCYSITSYHFNFERPEASRSSSTHILFQFEHEHHDNPWLTNDITRVMAPYRLIGPWATVTL
jgi:hypothetical protein